jgi:hypothetical protein
MISSFALVNFCYYISLTNSFLMFKIYGLMLNKFKARLRERVILKITFSSYVFYN